MKVQKYSTSEYFIWVLILSNFFNINLNGFTTDNKLSLFVIICFTFICWVLSTLLGEVCCKIYLPLLGFEISYLLVGSILNNIIIHYIFACGYIFLTRRYSQYMEKIQKYGRLQIHKTYILEKEDYKNE